MFTISSSKYDIPFPSIHVLSAWVRLGHKYQIDSLVEDALGLLRRCYPGMSLWELTDSAGGTIEIYRPSSIAGVFAIGVVNLARLVDDKGLLPLALLECCKVGAEVVHGYEREDGSRELLSPDDLARCFAATSTLVLQTLFDITALVNALEPD